MIEEAIKRAIESGYEPCEFKPYTDIALQRSDIDWTGQWLWIGNKEGEKCGIEITKIFFDKDFWVALGKHENWGSNCPICDSKANGLCSAHKYTSWAGEWHKFIDALIEGKPAEEFFASLLSDKS